MSRKQDEYRNPFKKPIYIRPVHDPDFDYDSGAPISLASRHNLGEGIRGDYNPRFHRIRIANDETDPYMVLAHESGHGRGLVDERATDRHAAYKIGSMRAIREFDIAPLRIAA